MDSQHAPRYTNRLAHERSPYLLQHAHNPVDWFPWGEEAFAEARSRHVPIFLSVGYSTCYWCHVMERESFENAQVAALMNSHFVCVKVDREERPDLDDLYMTATQAMTESGGWPMSVFIEPKTLKPFWCGTYFPPEPRWGRPSFPQLLAGIAEAWNTQKDEIVQQADELAEAVKERLGGRSAPLRVGERQVAQAVGQLFKLFDRVNAGFGEAPKFPQPVYLELLLRFRPHAGDEETSGATDAAIRHTLDRMAMGGIFDQVGGGFHRYSVDAEWLVPHFEKMLYDNAQLASVYARAVGLYDDPLYRRTLIRTLDYVLREMTAPDGAFFSAQDAEVNHREGQNYLWTAGQIREVLDPGDAGFITSVYGIDNGPNFRDPHHPQEPPSNVLFLGDRPEAMARSMNTSEADFLARLDRINDLLFDARSRRDQPGRDEKILAGWNGLMIGAFARAGSVLGRPDYLAAARRAADFIHSSMRDDSGQLLRSYRRLGAQAGAHIPAFLEDHAMVIHGLLEIHLAGADRDHACLDRALDLLTITEGTFGDPRTGAYYDTRADQDDLFVRARSQHDGAIPCGSSVMLNNLLDLAAITSDQRHIERAARCLASVSTFVAATPIGAANSTRGLLRLLTDHPAALESVFRDAPAPPDAAASGAPGETQPLAVYAAVERVTVGSDKPAVLLLQLRVSEGYHVNAADPAPGNERSIDLVGFRINVINGTGVAAYADYPPGEAYKPDWSTDAEEIRVYRGVLSIPVVLEREGEIKGTPLLAVTYQACTDDACLAPGVLELDVAIDVEK